MISGSESWRLPQGVRSLASAASIVTISLLLQMPGRAWSEPCCGTWLPERSALG